MIILYPTETVYGLGVDSLNKDELDHLYALKGRDAMKSVSWLVRDMNDVEQYAEVSEIARMIAERFLPGPLTLVLPAKKEALPSHLQHMDYIGFRVSSDAVAQKLIAEHNTPLTCTSANVAGMPTMSAVEDILDQFGEKKAMIDVIYDDGARTGESSTVIKVVGEEIECLREGAYPMKDILEAIK